MTRAVLLDALGTTVELDDPWVHLAAALGLDDEATVGPAVRKEMAYYKDHAHEAHDAASLTALRTRCAEILSWELNQEVSVDTMMSSIRFRAYDDALPALASLRQAGLKTVCVSNWDYSLPEVLERVGLGKAFDAVVTSADAGSKKPDPAIFSTALEKVGCSADEVVHVGDTVDEDVAGAGSAGIRALLIDRSGGGDIQSLDQLGEAVAGG